MLPLILWGVSVLFSTWVCQIHPEGENQFRLIIRVRVKYGLISAAAPFNLLTEFFDILMMRKSMLGIKRGAEKPLQVILPIFSPKWRRTILPG